MIEGKRFEILVTRLGEQRKYKLSVEIVYVSAQLLRFKLSAGERYLHMEKDLTKKRDQWKLGEMNFRIEGNPQEIALTIWDMQNELDFHLTGKRKTTYRH